MNGTIRKPEKLSAIVSPNARRWFRRPNTAAIWLSAERLRAASTCAWTCGTVRNAPARIAVHSRVLKKNGARQDAHAASQIEIGMPKIDANDGPLMTRP